ncbi:MAG: hypothetical protein Q8R79_01320 [Legionellaceae bacterium]|nr:hypothetical protein [Legionellaceae bacterium]
MPKLVEQFEQELLSSKKKTDNKAPSDDKASAATNDSPIHDALFQQLHDIAIAHSVAPDAKAKMPKDPTYTIPNLPYLLDYYEGYVDDLNPYTFKYLGQLENKAGTLTEPTKATLITALALFVKEYQRHAKDQRKNKKEEYAARIKKTIDLLNTLDGDSAQAPLTEAVEHTKYAVLFQMSFYQKEVQKTIDEAASKKSAAQQAFANKTGFILTWMGKLNRDRLLQWVWGSFILGSLYALRFEWFSANSFHIEQINDTIGFAGNYIMGPMSFWLYAARFLVNFSLLAKHTVKGPWMSAQEKKEFKGAWQAFQKQWKQRWQFLVNDSVWGIANFLCFAIVAAIIAGMLTVALLCMDLSVAIKSYLDARKSHNVQMVLLRKKIEALPTDSQERLQLEAALKKAERSWYYKSRRMTTDIVYATSLVISVAMVFSFFIPGLALPATLILAFSGAVLAFAFSIAYNAVNYATQYKEIKETEKRAHHELEELLEQSTHLQTNNPDNTSRYLFLRAKQAYGEVQYAQERARYHRIHSLAKTITNTLMPALTFTLLMFLPFPAAIGVLVAIVLLVKIAYLIAERYEPKKQALPKFEEKEADSEYELFLQEKASAPATAVKLDPKVEANRYFDFFAKHPPKQADAKANKVDALPAPGMKPATN